MIFFIAVIFVSALMLCFESTVRRVVSRGNRVNEPQIRYTAGANADNSNLLENGEMVEGEISRIFQDERNLSTSNVCVRKALSVEYDEKLKAKEVSKDTHC